MFPQKTPPSVINVPSTHIGCGSIIVDFVDYKLGKPSKEKNGNTRLSCFNVKTNCCILRKKLF